jgi:hypothetical protein
LFPDQFHPGAKGRLVDFEARDLGAGDFTLKFGGFALGGIGTATFGAILLFALLNREPKSA